PTQGDLLFGEILDELEARDLQPRHHTCHDGEALTEGDELLGSRLFVGQPVEEGVLPIILRRTVIDPPAARPPWIAEQIEDGVYEETAGPGLEPLGAPKRVELVPGDQSHQCGLCCILDAASEARVAAATEGEPSAAEMVDNRAETRIRQRRMR